MKKSKESIINILIEEGFRPKLDEDNDITFKYNGQVFVVFFDNDNDDEFIKLTKWIRLSDSIIDYKIAHDVTKKYKIGKCYIVNEKSLLLSVETLEDMNSFKVNLERYLDIINEMEKEYFNKVSEPDNSQVYH